MRMLGLVCWRRACPVMRYGRAVTRSEEAFTALGRCCPKEVPSNNTRVLWTSLGIAPVA